MGFSEWMAAVGQEVAPWRRKLLLFLLICTVEPMVLGEAHKVAAAWRVEMLAAVGYLLAPWVVALRLLEKPGLRSGRAPGWTGRQMMTVKVTALLGVCLVLVNASALVIALATRAINGGGGVPAGLFFVGINFATIVLAGVTTALHGGLERERAVRASGQIGLGSAAVAGFVVFFGQGDAWLQGLAVREATWESGLAAAIVAALALVAWPTPVTGGGLLERRLQMERAGEQG